MPAAINAVLLGYNLKIAVWGGVGVGVGWIKILWGSFFLVEGNEQIFGRWVWLPSMDNPVMCYLWVYIIHHNCHYDSEKTACFGKIFLKLYTQMLSANQIPRFFKFEYRKNYLRYKVLFLNLITCSWKIQFDHIIFFGFSQACPKCSEKN